MMEVFQGVIFDIDGVLSFQGKVIPGAIETVDLLRDHKRVLRFLTNSTLKSRASCAAKLRLSGFQVYDDEVLTASYATAVYLRSLQPRSAWVMLEGAGLDEFAGIPQNLDDPEYLVVGDNRSCFDFQHLNKAVRVLRNGAKLIGMTSELLDTSMGELELNVGSWVKLLELASGVQATYIGKPHRFAYELTLQGMQLDKSQVIAVGDRAGTDILGAKDFGIQSVLVKTGEFTPDDLHAPAKPDFVIDSLRDLPAILFREAQ
jgi:HAD superfamily hydrolase (TIGR01458 family)